MTLVQTMMKCDTQNCDIMKSTFGVISTKHDEGSSCLKKILQMLGVFSTNHDEISSTHIGFSTKF